MTYEQYKLKQKIGKVYPPARAKKIWVAYINLIETELFTPIDELLQIAIKDNEL